MSMVINVSFASLTGSGIPNGFLMRKGFVCPQLLQSDSSGPSALRDNVVDAIGPAYALRFALCPIKSFDVFLLRSPCSMESPVHLHIRTPKLVV